MGVFSFEQNRQYAVRTEVLALITLVEYGDYEQKRNALKQLMVVAYPHATAEKINKEKSIDDYANDDLSAVFHEGD